MSRPKMLLLDEPSMGLAPILVDEIFSIIRQVNKTGVTVLLVEQNATKALEIAVTAMCCPPARSSARVRGGACSPMPASARPIWDNPTVFFRIRPVLTGLRYIS